jgi:WD40 repeat protein
MDIKAVFKRIFKNTGSPKRRALPSPTVEHTYKAFISYSHAADGKLAPAIQTGLHRFAKPWYRLRAMRVFRDETTLATSPELWPSIESALMHSEYFLFLASDEAAKSYWVRKEFEYWLKRRSKDRMLIILTDGEILWDRNAGDFDWSKTTAIPQGIGHKFQDEPLYLDLRWAKTQEDLSLRNLTFRSAIADVASSLLERPKDELIGEDVRRHRQTRRITWSAIAALVLLTTVSIIAAVVAVRNQAIAVKQGAIALSRQLAAQAVSLAGSDRGDLALLLSLEALNVRPTVDARNGLLAALTRDPRRRFHLHGHMGEINSLAFTPDGQELLSLGCEGIDTLGLCEHFGVRRWDAKSGEPRGQVIVTGAHPWTFLTSTGEGKSVVVRDRKGNEWDPATGRSRRRRSVAGLTSPDGKIVVDTTGRRVVLRRADSRRQLAITFSSAKETIKSVAFHKPAPVIAVGGTKGEVQLWNTNALLAGSQEPLRIIDLHKAAVIDLEFSPDGQYLVTASWDDSVLLWNLKSASSHRRLAEGVDISSVAFSQDGRWLVIVVSIGERGGELHLWDAKRWQLQEKLAGKAPIAFDSESRYLAAAGADGAVIVRDLQIDRPLGRPLKDPGDPQSLTFLEKGRFLVAGGRDQTLRIWDVESGRLDRPPIHTGQKWVQTLAAHPDGKHIASGGQDGSVLLWYLGDRNSDAKHELIGRHDGPVGDLDFSRDGRHLVSGGFDDILRFWTIDTADRRPGRSPIDAGQDVYAVEFDHSDSHVAAATEDGSVLIWRLIADGATGRVVGTHLLQSDGMTGLSFGPQDRFLVSSSLEQTQLWGLKPGEPRVRAPIAGSFAVLSPTGELVAVVTDSDEIQLVDVGAWRVFDAPLGEQKDVVYAMAFSPDGRHLASAAKGDLVLWDVDIKSWRERACAIARRNLTLEEWELYLGNLPYRISCPDTKKPTEIPIDAERALGLAVRAVKLGESVQARLFFAHAAQLAAAGNHAELANRVCWFGAARDAFDEVMIACERAVELDRDNANYRDSRGLARAQAGDIAGAIEDFRAYLAADKKDSKMANRQSRRQSWIQALEAGRDPFDSMELHRVRSEGMFR